MKETICYECKRYYTDYGRRCVTCWIKRAKRFEEALREIAAGTTTNEDYKARAHPGGEYFYAASRFREIAQNALDSPRTRKESVR